MEMFLQWNEWRTFQTVTVICGLLLVIIYKLWYHIRYFIRTNEMIKMSSMHKYQGSNIFRYLSMFSSLYKQSSPTCPSLALGLQWVWAFCQLYGYKGLLRGHLLLKPFILFYKPETLEVLMSDAELSEKGNEYKLMIPWLGTGLITSGGTKWRKHRKLLTPTFHFSILENFIPVFQEQSEILVSKLQLHVKKPWIDVLPLLSSCTLDIICETAMGISINAQNDENSEYIKAIHEIADTLMYRGVRPWLYPDIIFNVTSLGRKFKKNIQIVHGLSDKVIKEKKIGMISYANLKSKSDNVSEESVFEKRKPFLELLLEYHLKDPSFTEIDVRDEVDTFMFAGHDTTAATITWVLYCLGIYPEIQEKVYEEQEEIFEAEENNKITRKTLTRMKFLECVIKETMRLFPTVLFILRENNKPFKVLRRDVHPGTMCCIFIFALHRDHESFPNPEIFDPDRFLPENSKNRHPYSYIPFSAGPRNCIGQKYAMIEMKTILSSILRRFRITSLDDREKVIFYPNIVTRSASPLRLRFESR